MANKITYLLGAGASANTIPIVADMQQRFIEVTNFLETSEVYTALTHIMGKEINSPDFKLKIERKTIVQEIISELKWLSAEMENYSTIDTLAKKYYLDENENENYERLKKCLIFYFTIEQILTIPSENKEGYYFQKKNIDKRYGGFISAIAQKSKGKIVLNNHIDILSWNYDIQFELNLKLFRNKGIHEIKNSHQIFPLLHYNDNDVKRKYLPGEFSMLKLNGNAIFSTGANNQDSFITIYDDINKYETQYTNDQLLILLITQWEKLDFHNNTACRFFNFAWEKNEDFNGRKHQAHHSLLSLAEDIAAQTEILVVIGYSFPIFNREIDNMLFNKMKKENLKKVYIQDKNPERIRSTMMNAFNIFKPTSEWSEKDLTYVPKMNIDFQLEPYTEQFVIPYELNQWTI